MDPYISQYYCSGSSYGNQNVVAGVHGGQFEAWKPGTASYTVTAQWSLFLNASAFGETQNNNQGVPGACAGEAITSLDAYVYVWPLASDGVAPFTSINSLNGPCMKGNWQTNDFSDQENVQYVQYITYFFQNAATLTVQFTFHAAQYTYMQARTSLTLQGYESCAWSGDYCYGAEPQGYVTAWADFIGVN